MITIHGIVQEIIYSNDDNGYTICKAANDDNIFTVVGYLPFLHIGEFIEVTGEWTTHYEYGEQLKAVAFEKKLPASIEDIELYLSARVIKGIGARTAKKIVSAFGEDTLNILQNHPQKLGKIKGIGFDKALKISQKYKEQIEIEQLVSFFKNYNIHLMYCTKIYKIFGRNTIEEIRKNPYRLTWDDIGLDFKTADEIAKNIGIDYSSELRIDSGIKYVLSLASKNGHTFLQEEALVSYIAELLKVDEESIRNSIISMVLNSKIYKENLENTACIYQDLLFSCEIESAARLARLSKVDFDKNITNFENIIKNVQALDGIILAEKQKEAIKEALISGVIVITGGPGTGKTTIIKSIISIFEKYNCSISLAAPTGKAAKRMSEATGHDAKTIHRLLEIGFAMKNEEPVFLRNESNPIDSDIVIIDEVSMLDILLLNSLLKAITQGTRLILVGDVDQLPSVGPGNVLKDIIESGVIKSIRLTEIFRQAKDSMIVVNAHKINTGEAPIVNIHDKDFFFMKNSNPQKIVDTILELCTKRLPQHYGFDPMKHIQILTPTKKSDIGVHNLNLKLKEVLNPPSKGKKEKKLAGYAFREGDKVMQIKNNYNLTWYKQNDESITGIGVFNGDTGVVDSIDEDQEKMVVIFEDERVVEYDFNSLDELELCYAMTIHKSQGSEFPAVIIPIYPGPSVLMTRNLLYTAITRAKNLVVLVGVPNTLMSMINNNKQKLRNSNLANRLKKYFEDI